MSLFTFLLRRSLKGTRTPSKPRTPQPKGKPGPIKTGPIKPKGKGPYKGPIKKGITGRELTDLRDCYMNEGGVKRKGNKRYKKKKTSVSGYSRGESFVEAHPVTGSKVKKHSRTSYVLAENSLSGATDYLNTLINATQPGAKKMEFPFKDLPPVSVNVGLEPGTRNTLLAIGGMIFGGAIVSTVLKSRLTTR